MKYTLAFLAASFLLSSCVGVNPNEGVFVVNNQVKPRLSEERLAEVRRAWTPSSQPKSEASKVGRDYAWWILDLIAHNESPPERPCAKLELLEIRPKELTLLIPRGDGYGFVRAQSYHEAWIVNACGTMREWRVLDDSANPHNPLRVFPWNAS
ncbi:hypothetical protein DBR42_30005 [Pelomonas sp. HMWF004]|nr:hypothetical protein DBR42_30005 [Pelomonas sp. HMWF004]